MTTPEEPPVPVSDAAPVQEDEAVLRLINKVYLNPALPTPVQPEAFRPTADDADGVSVFRERFVSPEELLESVPPEKRDRYVVARISVAELTSAGLTVIPDPIETPQGHALIPELNTTEYARNKVACKVVQKHLADLASHGIVTPTSEQEPAG